LILIANLTGVKFNGLRVIEWVISLLFFPSLAKSKDPTTGGDRGDFPKYVFSIMASLVIGQFFRIRQRVNSFKKGGGKK